MRAYLWRLFCICCGPLWRPQAKAQRLRSERLVAERDEDFLIVPPPPPKAIASQKIDYEELLQSRRFRVPRGFTQDMSLFALYRIYEYLLVDRTTWYRNAFEAFWRERDWALADIADPQDEDQSRTAFLAAVTELLMLAFNARIKLGLARGGPGILLEEEAEAMRQQSEIDKPYEKIPAWASRVQPLEQPLDLRAKEQPQVSLLGLSTGLQRDLDPCFYKYNILIETFHVHFT